MGEWRLKLQLSLCDIFSESKSENKTENSFGTMPVWSVNTDCTMNTVLEGSCGITTNHVNLEQMD